MVILFVFVSVMGVTIILVFTGAKLHLFVHIPFIKNEPLFVKTYPLPVFLWFQAVWRWPPRCYMNWMMR